MGNWQLEVFKMFCYMAFPVGMFHYFNRSENFEDFVIKVRKQSMHNPEAEEKLRAFIEKFQREEELKMIEAMELSDKKFKEMKSDNSSQII